MVSKYITGVHSCLNFALGRDIPPCSGSGDVNPEPFLKNNPIR